MHESTAKAIKIWSKDIKLIGNVIAQFSTMDAVLEDFPTATTVATRLWVSMAAEILTREDRKLAQQETLNAQEKGKLEEFCRDVSDFMKNAHVAVKVVNRKDMPAEVLSKIDKAGREQPTAFCIP